MAAQVKLHGKKPGEITDLASWHELAPPREPEKHWVDGYSAKEQAKAWLASGAPAVPAEIVAAFAAIDLPAVDSVDGWPEAETVLDSPSGARNHDLLVLASTAEDTQYVVGIEAKACESYDGLVSDRVKHGPPSARRKRCNFLSQRLFGCDVMAEDHEEILDADLGGHGYQLWTAAVGTLIEAQKRDAPRAVLLVHQFRPEDLDHLPDPADKRNWKVALERNDSQFEVFKQAVAEQGPVARGVGGPALHVVKAVGYLKA